MKKIFRFIFEVFFLVFIAVPSAIFLIIGVEIVYFFINLKRKSK
jgi:hypothetical protein